MRNYNDEFKRKVVKLHLEEGRTIRSLAEEYEISKASILNLVRDYREECQESHETKQEYDLMTENRRLRKKLEEAPMERYFNTLKNELIYYHSYRGDDSLVKDVSSFAFN